MCVCEWVVFHVNPLCNIMLICVTKLFLKDDACFVLQLYHTQTWLSHFDCLWRKTPSCSVPPCNSDQHYRLIDIHPNTKGNWLLFPSHGKVRSLNAFCFFLWPLCQRFDRYLSGSSPTWINYDIQFAIKVAFVIHFVSTVHLNAPRCFDLICVEWSLSPMYFFYWLWNPRWAKCT